MFIKLKHSGLKNPSSNFGLSFWPIIDRQGLEERSFLLKPCLSTQDGPKFLKICQEDLEHSRSDFLNPTGHTMEPEKNGFRVTRPEPDPKS